MYKIYVDKGSLDFIYQLPQIIYSSLILFVLTILLNLLALFNDAIIILKQYKSIELNDKDNIEKKIIS